MPLQVIGLNHKTASIDIREKLAISEHEIKSVVESFCQYKKIHACVIISTCNRTEYYIDCEDTQELLCYFCKSIGMDKSELEPYLYHKTNVSCIKHLFEVASGLDSMVLGEPQILGQVKSSYDISKSNNKLSNRLDRLFQTSFRVAKSVRSTTNIGKNPVSIANSAVQLSKQIFGELSSQNILVIGAGATSELLLRYLSKHSHHVLAISNRTISNAQKLAVQFNATTFAIEHLGANISDYDLIFTATSSKEPIITTKMIKQALKIRKHRPMVIIDIAIPRDVDAGVKKFNDVFYYAVDDLQIVISQNIQNRKLAAVQAKQIIEVEAESFCYWLKSQQHTKLIHKFQQDTVKIRKQILDKALSQLKNGIETQEVLFYLANTLTNKLSHKPVKAIRTAIESGDLTQINTIKNLLDLNETSGN